MPETESSKPDTYSWFARVMPMFIMLSPVAIAFFAFSPDTPVWQKLLAAGGLQAALVWLLSQLGRDMGYARQEKLWAIWGGAPTTQLLRHRKGRASAPQRERYHRRLMELDGTLALPTPEAERLDPIAADEAYRLAARFLIGKTRDQSAFPLIFKENVSYGFRRNLWGLKRLGLPLALAGAAVCVGMPWLASKPLNAQDLTWWASVLGSLSLVACWVFWIIPAWVRIPADAYAERLLEALDQLGT